MRNAEVVEKLLGDIVKSDFVVGVVIDIDCVYWGKVPLTHDFGLQIFMLARIFPSRGEALLSYNNRITSEGLFDEVENIIYFNKDGSLRVSFFGHPVKGSMNFDNFINSFKYSDIILQAVKEGKQAFSTFIDGQLVVDGTAPASVVEYLKNAIVEYFVSAFKKSGDLSMQFDLNLLESDSPLVGFRIVIPSNSKYVKGLFDMSWGGLRLGDAKREFFVEVKRASVEVVVGEDVSTVRSVLNGEEKYDDVEENEIDRVMYL